jgi:hypothetical protein
MGNSRSLSIIIWALVVSGVVLNFTLPAPVAAARDAKWVTVEGVSPMDSMGREEARKRATADAMQKAVEEAVSNGISAETLFVNMKLSGGVAAAIPYGRVVDKKIIEEGVVNVHPEGRDGNSVMYRVKMKAAVVEETTGADPSFRIDSSLNSPGYKDGDEMVMKIKSTKDCYIAVFNILEDEKVLRLMPNQYKKENFLRAHEAFSFPDNDDKKRGIKLMAHVPVNRDAVTETIYVLALKQPFASDTVKFQEGIYGSYDGRTAFINELIKEIAGIPLNERAERLMQYQIRKNK